MGAATDLIHPLFNLKDHTALMQWWIHKSGKTGGRASAWIDALTIRMVGCGQKFWFFLRVNGSEAKFVGKVAILFSVRLHVVWNFSLALGVRAYLCIVLSAIRRIGLINYTAVDRTRRLVLTKDVTLCNVFAPESWSKLNIIHISHTVVDSVRGMWEVRLTFLPRTGLQPN